MHYYYYCYIVLSVTYYLSRSRAPWFSDLSWRN